MLKKIIIISTIFVGLASVVFISISSPIVTKFPQSQLSALQKQEVERIFNKNFFSLTNFLPYEIDKNDTGQTYIKVYQIYQGIPVNEELTLHFDSNTDLFESVSGRPVPNIPISINETVNNADLVSKTMETIGENNSYYLSLARPIRISISPTIPAIIATLMARLNPDFWGVKPPLTAQLSIYNKNSSTSKPQDWTTAWTIQPKEQNYPIFIMDAKTGRILYSFNGIFY